MRAVARPPCGLAALVLAVLAGPACTEPNPYLNICGNGVHEPGNGEECDLGADNHDGGACTRACTRARCGDGLLQEGELCDLGADNREQGPCTPACVPPRCGDGGVQAPELCDDGELNADGYGPGCATTCTPRPFCGDGVVQAPELCDDGNGDDSDACLSTCAPSRCGDGVVQAPELCDDGNSVNNDGCLSTCEPNVCGDGYVHQGVEACDDGNADESDACLSTCEFNVCGDGFRRDKVEECDDGNLDPDDGCNHLCARDRLVFITEGVWGPKQVVGFDGAAQECIKIATAFGDPDPVRFRAWIGDGTNAPDTRFFHSKGRYVLPTGQVVADDWDDLTDGTLDHPIDRTRDGKLLVQAPVWTAVKPDGTPHSDGHCKGWTENSINAARIGWSDLVDVGWTDWPDGAATCLDGAHLYCFEAR